MYQLFLSWCGLHRPLKKRLGCGQLRITSFSTASGWRIAASHPAPVVAHDRRALRAAGSDQALHVPREELDTVVLHFGRLVREVVTAHIRYHYPEAGLGEDGDLKLP